MKRQHKFHYVYRTTNLVNGKFYIGVHSFDKLDNYYLGSGYNIELAVKKYGKENFEKELIVICETRELAVEKEKEFIGMVLDHPLCYNIHPGGIGGSYSEDWTEERRMNVSRANTGKTKGIPRPRPKTPKPPKDKKERISPFKGKPRPREWVEKSSATRKKRGYKNPALGERNRLGLSEESRKKLSETQKRVMTPERIRRAAETRKSRKHLHKVYEFSAEEKRARSDRKREWWRLWKEARDAALAKQNGVDNDS